MCLPFSAYFTLGQIDYLIISVRLLWLFLPFLCRQLNKMLYARLHFIFYEVKTFILPDCVCVHSQIAFDFMFVNYCPFERAHTTDIVCISKHKNTLQYIFLIFCFNFESSLHFRVFVILCFTFPRRSIVYR